MITIFPTYLYIWRKLIFVGPWHHFGVFSRDSESDVERQISIKGMHLSAF